MTAREIARIKGISTRAIQIRAIKEGWKFTAKRCRGGKAHDFCVSTLPADILLRVSATKIIRDKTLSCADRFIESPWFERLCWTVMIYAVLHFGFCIAWSQLAG
ncbi:MAG: hypothetical protein WC378_19835 [Opitutaceae bacterium]|jgi:hypothetical protein